MGCILSSRFRRARLTGTRHKSAECGETNARDPRDQRTHERDDKHQASGERCDEREHMRRVSDCDNDNDHDCAPGGVGMKINQSARRAPVMDLGQGLGVSLHADQSAATMTRQPDDETRLVRARDRKRQKFATSQAPVEPPPPPTQPSASFLSLFVHGRRQSAVRIDAAATLATNTQNGTQVEQRPPLQNGVTSQELAKNSGECSSSKQKRKLGQLNARMTTSERQQQHQQHQQHEHGTNEFEQSDSDVLLFTSVQQLCHEIVAGRLLNSPVGEALCLFVLGRPGSSKGELAFELVEHSSLVDALNEPARLTSGASSPLGPTCPLYHYLDVSALIVAHIDRRIREYHRLVERTLRIRRQQLAREDNNSAKNDDDSDELRSTGSLGADCDVKTSTSCGSTADSLSEHTNDISAEADGDRPTAARRDGNSEDAGDSAADAQRRVSIDHQFSIVTLSTRQRSVLQLKLMKYATCVTAKWVAILVNQEIARLERKLRAAMATNEAQRMASKSPPDSATQTPDRPGSLAASAPSRVYLVNLVPNQLSIFKSCLYLDQSLTLADFRRPHWAIQFERRTNIRVLRKERALGKSGRSAAQQVASGGHHFGGPFHFKLSHIRLPILTNGHHARSAHSLAGAHRRVANVDNSPSNSETGSGSDSDSQQPTQNVGQAAGLALANSVNEKLGPKYNEQFASQFKAAQKLTLVRYNPSRAAELQCSCGCYSPHSPVGAPTSPLACSQSAARPSSSLSHLNTPVAETYCESGAPLQERSGSLDQLGQLELPSPASTITASGSLLALSSSRSLSQLSERSPSTSGSSASDAHAPKWAVELELVDGRESCDNERACEVAAADGTLLTFVPPTRLNARSFTHMFAINSHPAQCPAPEVERHDGARSATGAICEAKHSGNSSKQHQHQYALMVSQVAYANGASQRVLEVKRHHKGVFKCGSHADAVKLLKLATKAGRQLGDDLQLWLAGAVASKTVTPTNHTNTAHLRANHTLQPPLVTYTIRVDLSRLPSDFRRSASALQERPADGQLSPVAGSSLRPASTGSQRAALVPIVVTSANGRQASAHKNRHVQFALDHEPLLTGAHFGRPAQRRLWISDTLFVSTSDKRLCELLEYFADWLRCQHQRD